LPIRPDQKLTPGAVLTSDTATICEKGYAKTVRHTSGKLKTEIDQEYGIDKRDGHFEVDHLISLELGGADVAANLDLARCAANPDRVAFSGTPAAGGANTDVHVQARYYKDNTHRGRGRHRLDRERPQRSATAPACNRRCQSALSCNAPWRGSPR
jgi:hypothetical protein